MTVAEAAKVCRTAHGTMKTWVAQFEKGKLLRGIDKVLVRGRSKDRYGPAAEKFVVPLRQVPEKTGDIYIRRLSALSEPFDPNVGRPRGFLLCRRLGAGAPALTAVPHGGAKCRKRTEASETIFHAKYAPPGAPKSTVCTRTRCLCLFAL